MTVGDKFCMVSLLGKVNLAVQVGLDLAWLFRWGGAHLDLVVSFTWSVGWDNFTWLFRWGSARLDLAWLFRGGGAHLGLVA